MQAIAKDFSHLIGTLEGLSEAQLKAHFGLYQGYVNKLNEIQEKLATADRSKSNYSFGEYSELKRREAVAFNGTYLHQIYFENLNGSPTQASEELKAELLKTFASMESFEQDMKASALSTPGWVLLTWNQVDQSLHHYIMYEHHIGLPVMQDVILALDCWEHAFMIDYGTNKADYLATFTKNIDWNVASERLKKARR